MSTDGTPTRDVVGGLARVGGAGLIGFATLQLTREIVAAAAGPPPGTGDALIPWLAAHEWLLGAQTEILFFALMCLIPAVPALFGRLRRPSPVLAALGCGTVAAAIPVLAVLDIVHGRFAFPVYGLHVDTPAVAGFAVAVYYGGLHAVQLMLAFAVLMISLAMTRARLGGRLAQSGSVAALATVLTGYPWVIGASTSLVLHLGVATWWGAVGRMLFQSEEQP